MAPTVLVEYTGLKELKKNSQKVSVAMMGKRQKFSKGYSSGFVSDYRHAVETMSESEGIGSSGRLDTEMTASEEGSCAPKRKCISLNFETCNGFGVPLRVLPVSKLSQSERKDLEMKLRTELEQVRVLQGRIALQGTNGVVALSSSSDIRSCNDGQRMHPLENFRRSSGLSSGQEKKQVPPGGNDPPLKRRSSGRFESVKQGAPLSTSNVMLMKQCETLLKRLMSHQFGWVFNTPVDTEKLNIPDYFQVIKHPMDLGTIKRKITSGGYSSPVGFVADVRLTFSNAMTYNPPGNDVHVMADTLRKYFEKRWESVEKKLVPVKPSVPRDVETAKLMPSSKKRKIPATDVNVKAQPVKRIMTDGEKHNLSKELESLLGDMPEHIVDFLRGHSFNGNQTGEDEIEVDIDALSDDTLFTLRKLLDDYLRKKQINQANAEPCEIEILNESGLSNSSMPCKGNEPVDEDVDIGGNDPPVSSYPPVEIEKDTAHKNSRCSSSSSSSSESGSSSSDSDSGSSSGSESERAKASSPVNTTKVHHDINENSGSGADIEQRRSDLIDPHDGNQSISGVDQLEQNPQTRPVSVETDGHQEGESAPSERQVSPDKLYRAALLRSRFADTILKAREKALDQGEKGDPEKLQREREELEKQQSEEKARLQAEAKAAEDARRQAEAEAAAEAKRRRELEREAARQALLKVIKNVSDLEERITLFFPLLSYLIEIFWQPTDGKDC
ncbi:hypothetical protein NE237_020557 [Protea cynaroides]|uniref:Transcription factor GTE8 n=1 Tax=Protea cynaroides TaxID=273540 RepID=A0A9Q0K2P9_9MAGN|nr:hypothetical protein NE237_020557 [Protea cynaroides]